MTKITVKTDIKASLDQVWKAWTSPEDIIRWNQASPDWHTPSASNDLKEGGRFRYRMEAKDGSMGFDFGGKYLSIKEGTYLEYKLPRSKLPGYLTLTNDSKYNT